MFHISCLHAILWGQHPTVPPTRTPNNPILSYVWVSQGNHCRCGVLNPWNMPFKALITRLTTTKLTPWVYNNPHLCSFFLFTLVLFLTWIAHTMCVATTSLIYKTHIFTKFTIMRHDFATSKHDCGTLIEQKHILKLEIAIYPFYIF